MNTGLWRVRCRRADDQGYLGHDSAERAIWRLKEADRAYWETRDKFEAVFDPIRRSNAYPRPPNLLPQPKRPNGKKNVNWPQEYWDRKAEVDAHNDVAQAEYKAKLEVYFGILTSAAAKAFDSLEVPLEEREQFDMSCHGSGCSSGGSMARCRIEELEVER